MDSSINILLMWLTVLIVPPLLGFLLGKLRNLLVRMMLLVLLVLTPVCIVMILVVVSSATQGDLFGWWVMGMIAFSPMVLAWMLLVGLGYFGSRFPIRHAR